jgi:hypothetical protein
MSDRAWMNKSFNVLAAVGLGLKGCYGLLVPVESHLLDIGGVERFAMKAA